jgi:Ca-activated chloride channel family protein
MYRLLVIALGIAALAGGAGAVTLKDEMHSNVSRGNSYYEAGDHEMALERYREAQGLDSTFAIPHFNAGDALYRMGNYRDGAMAFLRSSSSDADSIKAMSYYNLGNTMFQAGDLESAAEAYKRSLLLDPEDRDAKHNLELALKMQQQQEQQQDQQQDSEDRQQDQQGGEDERQEQEQEKDEKEQQGQDQEEQQQPQPGEQQQPPEISPEELERILAAIEASDRQTQEEMMRKASQRKTVTGKDW